MSNKFHIGHLGYAPGGVLPPDVDQSLFWVVLEDARIDIEGLKVLAGGFLPKDDKLEQLYKICESEYVPFFYSIPNRMLCKQNGQMPFVGRIEMVKSKRACRDDGTSCLSVGLLIKICDAGVLAEEVNSA